MVREMYYMVRIMVLQLMVREMLSSTAVEFFCKYDIMKDDFFTIEDFLCLHLCTIITTFPFITNTIIHQFFNLNTKTKIV